MNEQLYLLSLVICAVDETFMLERTFRKLDSFGPAYEYLFVLSQNCTSGCLAVTKKLCERPGCRWMYQSGKGVGNALQDAISEVRGTHMAIWSADEATDVSSFPEMLRLSMENPEKIVKISRFLHENGFEGYGWIKKRLNTVSQRAFGLLFRSKLTEFTNPTQIAPVSVYRRIRWEHNGFDFLPELIFKPLKLGVEFIEVPTKNVPREEGRSHNGFVSHLRYYRCILKIFLTKKEYLVKEAQG